MKNWMKPVRQLWKAEEGIGTLEIILIIAVIIILAILFKDWILTLLKRLMGKADEQADKIFK
ncbi:Flp1 family type IVb pilin [Paenibacillus sp. GCM10027626]|uniref:Flp1 family type IVb pilin n=1 Tax=Paenibacillus sp. GCM10027626 TaxID=3273411 RepID=UPI003631BAED